MLAQEPQTSTKFSKHDNTSFTVPSNQRKYHSQPLRVNIKKLTNQESNHCFSDNVPHIYAHRVQTFSSLDFFLFTVTCDNLITKTIETNHLKRCRS